MPIELPALPFDKKDLAPNISEETIEYHYGKHHKGYVDKLNGMIEGTEFADKDLLEIVKTAEGGMFNNAAQIWNHTFYWNCLQSPLEDKIVIAELREALEKKFGGLEKFVEEFAKAAAGLFGSGWVWLVKDDKGLSIVTTSNADTPIRNGQTPLLTCDVWEHAYYIDYRNARPKYLEAFWPLVNWGFVSNNFGG